MYSIIITIHILFIFLCHLLGFRFLEGIFLVLCLFFLFYFSPLFFFEKSTQKWNTPLFSLNTFLQKLSPKESVFLPLSLLYIAIYWFIISSVDIFESFFIIHTLITIAIFLIIFGYILSFEWKNDIFFEIFGYHIYVTFFTGIIFLFLTFFWIIPPSPFYFLLGIIGSIAWVFFLTHIQKISQMYIPFFLTNILTTLFLFFRYLLEVPSLDLWITLSIPTAILFFEYFPKISIYTPYTLIIRFFSLSIVLISLPVLLYTIFLDITLPFILIMSSILFLLSVHVRFSNYISYWVWLILIFFLYSVFFISLLSTNSLLSVLMFIFFLPFLLISLTFFWEERYEYDFIILHYCSIFFSGIYSIYSLFFIWWWWGLLFMISSCIFWIAVLFFLSYFRFKKF